MHNTTTLTLEQLTVIFYDYFYYEPGALTVICKYSMIIYTVRGWNMETLFAK